MHISHFMSTVHESLHLFTIKVEPFAEATKKALERFMKQFTSQFPAIWVARRQPGDIIWNLLGFFFLHRNNKVIVFQAITIKRSSSAQGGDGNYEVITIEDTDDIISTNTKTAESKTAAAMTAAHMDSQSGTRTDCLARGSASQRDYLSRGGAQTLGGAVRVESVTALRSTPQWLTASTTTSLSSSQSVRITQPGVLQNASAADLCTVR